MVRKPGKIILFYLLLLLFSFAPALAGMIPEGTGNPASSDSYDGPGQAKTDELAPAVSDTAGRIKSYAAFLRQRMGAVISTEGDDQPTSFDAYFRYVPPRSAGGFDGSVAVAQAAAETSYDFKAFKKLPVQFLVDVGYIGIENTTQVDTPSHLTSVSFDLETTLPFFKLKDTYLRLGLSPSFNSDSWSFSSSDFCLPSRALLIYMPRENLIFVGGIAVYPGYEDKFIPFGGVIYKPNDRLAFNLVPKRANIIYDLTKKWSVFLEGDAMGREFNVKKDGVKGFTLRYKELHAGGGVKFKMNKYFNFYLSSGYMFNRTLKYRDSQGKISVKNNVYTEFRIESSF